MQGKEPRSPLRPHVQLCACHPVGQQPHRSALGCSWRLHPCCRQPSKPSCEGGEAAEGQPRRDAVPALDPCVGKRGCMADRAPAGSCISTSEGFSQENGHTAMAWHGPASSLSTNSADAEQRGLLQEHRDGWQLPHLVPRKDKGRVRIRFLHGFLLLIT